MGPVDHVGSASFSEREGGKTDRTTGGDIYVQGIIDSGGKRGNAAAPGRGTKREV